MKTTSKQLRLGFAWSPWLLGIATLFTTLYIATPELAAQCQAANRARPDFDGNCVADLAIGAPGETNGPFLRSGAVQIIYGTGAGLAGAGTKVIHAGMCTLSQVGAISGNGSSLAFGSVLTWGDFNGDRYDDLAIGIPDYNPPYQPAGMPEAGMVYVLFGSNNGLNEHSVQHFVSTNLGGANQFGGGIPSLNVNQNTFDRFGHALAAGDFNGDTVDDLAIGTPGEEGWNGVSQIEDAGDVYVLYGRRVGLSNLSPGGYDGISGGLDARTAQGWNQNGRNLYWYEIQGDPQARDRFGTSLVAGDFNGDGRADLAIGAPGEAGETGAVNVIYGSPTGLHPAMNQYWHQDVALVEGVRAAGERFGYSLAAGDFNGDGRADLAIGSPRASAPGFRLTGEVNVIYGSGGGLNPAAQGLPPDQLWQQNGPLADDGVLGGELFGFALATADFDGDTKSDLVVGAPFDSPTGVTSAGAVNIIYGSAFGLTFADNQYLHQESLGWTGENDPHSYFGRHLFTGKFNGDGFADLAVGIPGEIVAAVIGAGAINVVYGGLPGLFGPEQIWDQNRLGGISGLDEAFGTR
jgi:hypothetical protein